ncbi:hypothetical protein KWW45_11485 [Clostridioides difficile]|uniref:hypothetical protein n=1 Tax=Clostridioides difficile TaxID=1496 RepID=UPI000943B1AB|nr:hypothetical protein [Clostridioides difficile]KAK2245374.1 hypothetical protein XC29_00640 [Clostridioides difficile]MBY1968816.1 hypothetical protein [Clostridioides difficile]MDM9959232.1 hypothetical protein [Clostridioides difficile]MDO0132418.1 hypothetical protein [Clostridioides difficile]
MKNYIARCLSNMGVFLAGIQVLAGIIIMCQKVEIPYDYLSDTYEQYSPIMIGIGSGVIVSGIVICLVLKGLAELVENSTNQMEYQKGILTLLKNNNGIINEYENISKVKLEKQFTNEELPKL